jgi:uncharacterized repeat protein (TIGR01451 family)
VLAAATAALSALALAPAVGAVSGPSTPVIVPELVHDVSPPLVASPAAPPSRPLLGRLPGTGGGYLFGPIESFEGVANADNLDRVAQPDAEGDVGPSRYVEWANTSLAIFDKTGRRLVGPIPGSAVWNGLAPDPTGAASLCDTTNRGDPVVLYDQLDDRWVLSQFAWDTTGPTRRPPYVQCIAVSTGPDPAGSYYRYAFRMPGDLWNDYSKLGLWPSAFVHTDVATGPASVVGAGVFALDRAAMVDGRAANAVYTLVRDAPPLLPVDLDGDPDPRGALPRPLGPVLLVGLDDDGRGASADGIEIWRFQPDFADVRSSRVTGPTPLATQPFDSVVCATANCIRQPGVAPLLDPLSDRLMFRAEYRRLPGADAIALTHTVRADDSGRAGVRWYELVDRGSGFRVGRWGVVAPDGDGADRWVGSAALDSAGNLGLGFSVSSDLVFPSIGYTGIPADPAAVPTGEGRLAVGGGAETSLTGYWGDYASLTVDPVDGCTFWFTQEYYPASSGDGWHTRIGSFRFPTCGTVPAISGGPTVRDGELVTASPGSGPSLPGASFEYRWRRCDTSGGACADIGGATGAAYRLQDADVHSTIRVVVTATGAAGTASSLSAPAGPVAPTSTAPLDLVLSADRVARVSLGARVSLTVHVANHGNGTATGIVLTATLPAALALQPSESDSRCTGSPRVVCDLGFLPAGGSTSVTIAAKAAARGSSTVAVAVAGDQLDPVPATNTVALSALATAPPVLRFAGARSVGTQRRIATIGVRISIDESASLRLGVRSPSGGPVRLLPGTRLAGNPIGRRRSSLGAFLGRAGTFGVRASFRAARHGTYRLVVRAVDRDGLASSIVLPMQR